PRLRRERPRNVYRGTDRSGEQFTHILDELVRIERARIEMAPAREGQELLGELCAAHRCPHGAVDELQGSRLVQSRAEQFKVAEHGREQVVEIMGDAAGELA